MRPAAFTYTRPATLADALRALAAGAVPLAGGQSLVQAMRLRSATPRAVVDLAGVAELSDAISISDEVITIGAHVTHAALLEHALVINELPWLHEAAQAGALVEVDVETGRVDVIKIWMVADHGVVLNPLVLAGQIKGGVVQQLGGTLYEVYDYDEHGKPRASTLKEYGMPTVWAAPEIEIHHLTTPATSNRVGSKGGGEDGCIATSTVLMGAVEDALRPLGVKVMSSPLSPARIRAMIEAASGTAP